MRVTKENYEHMFKKEKYGFLKKIILIFVLSLISIFSGLIVLIRTNSPVMLYIGIGLCFFVNILGIFLLANNNENIIRDYAFEASNIEGYSFTQDEIKSEALSHFKLSIYGDLPIFKDLLTGSYQGVCFYSYSVSFKPGPNKIHHEALMIDLEQTNIKMVPEHFIQSCLIGKNTKVSTYHEDNHFIVLLHSIPVQDGVHYDCNPLLYDTPENYLKHYREWVTLIHSLIDQLQ